jgi:Zn-dependent protease/CBS domain-containing protein
MFGKRVKLFKLLGFEVRIDISWLIVLVLATWALAEGLFPSLVEGLSKSTYWWMGITGAIGLFLSVVLHELSHSVVARRYGIPMKGITLFIFGGVAEMEDEPSDPRSELMMAIAGPVASIVIGLVFISITVLGVTGGWPDAVVGVIQYVGGINLILAAFNLVPAFPLDGGRVLRAVLWHFKGSFRRATEISSNIGSGFGIVLIFAGVVFFVRGEFLGGIWWVFLGLFLRNAVRMSRIRMELKMALRGEKVERFMKKDPVTVDSSVPVEELVEDYIYGYHYKMFPVVEDGKVIGCITTTEVKEVPREDWKNKTVRDIMSSCSEKNSISPHADAMDALKIMRGGNISRILVVDGGKLAGIVTLKDMLEFISLKMDLEDKFSRR